MRVGYLVAALLSLVSIVLSIFLASSPRWIIDYRSDGYVSLAGLHALLLTTRQQQEAPDLVLMPASALHASFTARPLLDSNPLLLPLHSSQTNYGLFVYESCTATGPDRVCYFVFYSNKRTSSLYPYYKAGALGGAFIIAGIILYFMFMVFMFIKASTGLAGRCMHRVFNNYYVLYYLGLVAVFIQALGWGLFLHYVPRTFKLRYPFYIFLFNWITIGFVVVGVFVRKIVQGNAKRGGWMSIA